MKCVLPNDREDLETRIVFTSKDPLDPKGIAYTLFIIRTRKFALAKTVLLNRLMRLYEVTKPPREGLLVMSESLRKRILTVCEGLAN